MKLFLPLSILFFAFTFCSGKLAEFVEKKGTPSPEASNSSSPSTAKLTPEKLDDETLKTRLVELVDRWTKVQVENNRAEHEKMLADEFTNIDGSGKKYNKKEWLDALEGGNPDMKSWKFSEETIESNTGDTAVLSLIITYTLTDGTTVKNRDTNKFVNRDGRWLLVSSQTTVVK